jgi:hypothetical protein
MFSRESGRAHLTIEDPSGDVRLNLKTAVYEPGLYFEGGVYGFEGSNFIQFVGNWYLTGSYDGYEFIVERAFLPKLNDPEKVQQKSTIPNNDLIVFLSGVPFDNDKVLNGLSQLFEGFKFDPPSIFVLFGPFTSVQKAYDYTNDQLAAFQQFVRLLKKVAAKNPAFGSTQFILIPSFEDPPSLIVMPRF